MNIAITGASGWIGGHLLRQLANANHELRLLARHPVERMPERARFYPWDAVVADPPPESLNGADVVIHLAGAPAARRWTAAVKRDIRDSRVIGTRRLIEALSRQAARPAVLISASGIGYYGSRGDETLTETSTPGSDFLAQVCRGWEAEADQAQALGIRVVKLRIGMVLGRGGGALQQIKPIFEAGMGGVLGSGKQWVSWIHLEDVLGLIRFALDHESLGGAVNATAPNPVRNSEFTHVLGHALHRPAMLRVPEFGLRLMYGEMAEIVLASQRALPAAAEQAGYSFQFPQLEAALNRCIVLH